MPPLDRRATLGWAGVLLAAAPLKAAAQNTPGAPAVSDEELRRAFAALWIRFNRSLAARDSSLLDLFTGDDALLVGSANGEEFAGRAAIAEHLRTIFALPVVLSFRWDRQIVRPLGADAAWIWAEGALILTDPAGKQTIRPYRLTAVLVRRNDAWKIQLFSGSEPAAE